MMPADNPLDPRTEQMADEVELLIWGLLDEQLDEADVMRLESLLQENEAARERYLSCVQLHCDLVDHYQPQRPQANVSPILTSLGNDLAAGSDSLPQVAE